MLTNSLIEEQMMTSLRSPEDLSHRLGLRPTESQAELMHRFYEDEDPLQVVEVPSQQTTNAVALCALWRLLRVEGSRCIVIAANRDLEGRFLKFVRDITTTIDPALTSVCKWTNGRTMRLGDHAGHELRMLSNIPEWLQGLHGPTTFVVLGAKSSETKFCDTLKVVDTYRGQEGMRHIVMW